MLSRFRRPYSSFSESLLSLPRLRLTYGARRTESKGAGMFLKNSRSEKFNENDMKGSQWEEEGEKQEGGGNLSPFHCTDRNNFSVYFLANIPIKKIRYSI